MSTNSTKAMAGRIGGLTLHATHNSAAIAANARRGLDAKFEREVRETAAAKGETLTPEEVVRRAEYAKKAYFARLSLKSAQARSRGAGRGTA